MEYPCGVVKEVPQALRSEYAVVLHLPLGVWVAPAAGGQAGRGSMAYRNGLEEESSARPSRTAVIGHVCLG